MPNAETSVILIGLPSDLSVEVSQGNRTLFPGTQWSNLSDEADTEHQGKYLKGFDAANQALLPFTNALFDARHPKGFSGAGAWFRKGPTPEGKPWEPNLGFAGVAINYYEGNNLLGIVGSKP